MLHTRPPKSRHKKGDPTTHYTSILKSFDITTSDTSVIPIIHARLTTASLTSRPHNTILHATPPEINTTETSLPRKTRTTLAQLRAGKHPSLNSFRHLIDHSHPDTCPHCPMDKHTTEHILLDCPAHHHLRQKHAITALEDLWVAPEAVANYLEDVGLH